MSGETAGIQIKSSQITDLEGVVPKIVAAPATAASAGIATNTWVRATLATW